MELVWLFRDLAPYHLNVLRYLSTTGIAVKVFYFSKRFSINEKIENVEFIHTRRRILIFSKNVTVITAGYSNLIWTLNALFHKIRGGYTKFTSDTIYDDRKVTHKIYSLFGSFLFPFIFDEVIVAGRRQVDFAKILGFTSDRIKIGCYSADFGSSELQFSKALRVFRFIFIGRLAPEKGLIEFLTSVNRIPLKHELFFDIYGFGPLEYEIQRIIKTATNPKFKVSLLGRLDHNNLTDVLKEYEFFVLPSLFEPWGVVVHEAVNCGLVPILSERVGSSDLFARDFQNGFIYSSFSELEDILNEVFLLNSEQYNKLSRLSYKAGGMLNPKIVGDNFL